MEDDTAELVFQLYQGDSGIFLTKKHYVRLTAIQQALEKARTWGEFEQLCPDGEFETLPLWQENGGEHVYEVDGTLRFIEVAAVEEIKESGRNYVITPEQAFDSSLIPGVEDANYPPWLDSSAESVLPEAFVKTFAEVVSGGPTSGGTWTEYPVSQIDKMVRWLDESGYSVAVHLAYD